MSNRVTASEIEPGMMLLMRSGSWVVDSVETVASSTGPLVRLVTRGFRTGARKPITLGMRHTVKIRAGVTA